jgi:tryptophan synthase alpha chain
MTQTQTTNRLTSYFSHPRSDKTFIPFLVIGDPNPEVFLNLVKAIEPYADILEFGIPFSDPIADGPVIQSANQRALQNGITLEKSFDLLRTIRSFTEKPMVILTYANIIGLEPNRHSTIKRLADAGVDAIIAADVPIEEADPFLADLHAVGMEQIFLVAPTTTESRLQQIVTKALGFLYLVSVKGTTGTRDAVRTETQSTISRITSALQKASVSLPVCVGFGLSKPEHVREVLSLGADGAIVGSAIIKFIEDLSLEPLNMIHRITEYIQIMKDATKSI